MWTQMALISATILRITCQRERFTRQRENQKDVILPGGSKFVQYVNYLLLASKTHKDCLKYTVFPCTALSRDFFV